MKNLKTWHKIIIGIVILFILIQFIPVKRTNPPVDGRPEWNNQRTKDLVHRSCIDCHSHETRWPWYAYVAPSSWLVSSDVQEGREYFNLSVPPFEGGEHAAEMVEKGEMPLDIYQWMHSEANYTEAEKKELIEGLKATFGSSSDESHEDHDH